jgi:hypothetical protein
VSLYGVLPHEKESTTIPDRTVITHQDLSGFYLTDYAHAMGYSGGVATIEDVIVGVISARVRGESQGVIIPVSAAGEWLQSFQELQQSFTTLVIPAKSGVSSALLPQDERTRFAKSTIRSLLHPERMKALCEAIEEQTGAASAIDGLFPIPPVPLRDVLVSYRMSLAAFCACCEIPHEP